MVDGFQSICGSKFWDKEFWDSSTIKFSSCFQNTVLVWIPCGFLWLFTPLEIYFIYHSSKKLIPWTILNISKLITAFFLVILSVLDFVYIVNSPSTKSYYSIVGYVAHAIKAITVCLAMILTILGRKKGIHSSGILFLFWLLMLIGMLGVYYSYLLEVFNEENTIPRNKYFYITTMIYFPLVCAEFILHCFADKTIYKDDTSKQNECPEMNASFLSKLLFWWFTDLIVKGWKKPLTQSDLWLLRPEDRTNYIIPKFDQYWQNHLDKRQSSSISNVMKHEDSVIKHSDQKSYYTNIIYALWKCFGLYFVFGTILKIIYDLLQFVNPQLLGLLISFIEGDEPLWRGIFYAVLMFISGILQSVIVGVYFHCMFVIAMRIRTALISAIYRKSLILSSNARRESTLGEIVNLMSVDTQRFMDIMPYINLIWSAPLQIVLCIYFLWNILGPSVLAGVGVMVLTVPLNGIVASKSKKLQVEQMKKKDNRVKLMNEILNGIKVLKLYAWEEPFQEEILKIRNKEIDQLKSIAYLNSVAVFLWTCAPILVALATFAVYVLIDEYNILDANTAFVSMSLFNILRFPMTMLPNMITMLVMVNVSIKRINKFLSNEELNPYVSSDCTIADPIVIQNGTFSWNEEKPVLKNINISIPSGKLVAIVGQVGCGKSSLISAMLGDMELLDGSININGRMAYVPQQAWIQNATIKQNILFTESFNKHQYNRIVEASALLPDFDILPGGDMTEIGEKGINLSGGQKQRISLARAVYNDADIYFLDDPLSAVDSHVGKHIFDKVIGPKSLLYKKTRILVSHGITFLPQTDIIIVLKNGKIAEMGSYSDLLKTQGEFSDFILQYLNEEGVNNENLAIIDEIVQQTHSNEIKSQLMRAMSETGSPRSSISRENSISTSLKTQHSDAHDKSTDGSIHNKSDNKSKLIDVEAVETGKVKFSVYKKYFEAIGYLWLLIIIINFFGVQAFSVGSNIWLSDWSNDKTNPDGSQDLQKRNLRLEVYGALGAGQGFCALLGSFALAYGTIRASSFLHKNILSNILRSPMSFFDTTPLGRIINRFAKDIDTIDVIIPISLRSWFQCVLNVVGTIFIITLEVPIFLVVILPIGVIYYLVQIFYIATSRQLKRLESITRSPIYSHFSETLTGVSTIRAYCAQNHFIEQSNQNVDVNQGCYYPSVISNRWLAIYLEFCGNCIILFAGLFAVMGRDYLNSGTVGLIVSYALPVTAYLSWMVRMSSELETNIVAVERVIEYSNTDTEADWEIPHCKPDSSWPENGQVDFQDYSTKYRKELNPVLKSITCHFKPKEKIGVVGRTGAGKSSLTLSLFRIIESFAGKIIVDGLDISKLGLHDLRSKLTIIPQDPVLFSGTLRINLDPFDLYSDSDIWQALEHSHLKAFASTLEMGLQHTITEGGENLSVGQRQLVCLARALLRKTKILVLDEATAAVDLETDDLIQTTIRQEFAHCTIITIAHRLNTVIDYDRILVLDNGIISEFDTPSNLLKDKSSIFYSMAKDAGLI